MVLISLEKHVFEPPRWQRSLLICWPELNWNPLASSWWPVHGHAIAVEAWFPCGEQCEVGRSQCGEDDGSHTWWGSYCKQSGSQCPKEAWSAGYLYREDSRKMVTRLCQGCSVPEGQCLLGGCLGPSNTRCPHTHTADLPHGQPETSREPPPPTVSLQHSLLRKLHIMLTEKCLKQFRPLSQSLYLKGELERRDNW